MTRAIQGKQKPHAERSAASTERVSISDPSRVELTEALGYTSNKPEADMMRIDLKRWMMQKRNEFKILLITYRAIINYLNE